MPLQMAMKMRKIWCVSFVYITAVSVMTAVATTRTALQTRSIQLITAIWIGHGTVHWSMGWIKQRL